jgi:hypothetical protein
MTVKRILCAARLRRIPAQFSWVDPRLVFDGHLGRLDTHAAALYLLLVAVADAQGLSYWGDARVTQLLHTTRARLARSREQLVGAGLLAYDSPLYQVLALDNTSTGSPPPSPSPSPSPSPPTPTPTPTSTPTSTPAVQPAGGIDRADVLQRLAELRARLTAPR